MNYTVKLFINSYRGQGMVNQVAKRCRTEKRGLCLYPDTRNSTINLAWSPVSSLLKSDLIMAFYPNKAISFYVKNCNQLKYVLYLPSFENSFTQNV